MLNANEIASLIAPTATKVVTWTLGNGKTATVTITERTHESVSCDGYEIAVAKYRIDVVADIEGMGRVGTYLQPGASNPRQPQVVANIGKLGLTSETLALVTAAINEIKSGDNYQSEQARIAANNRANDDYEAHCAMMDKAMRE